MATSYWIDKSEKTADIFAKLIKKFFPQLKTAKMMYTLRDGDKTDKEGNLIVAEAIKVGKKTRDLFGPDFEICMDANLWSKANKADKYQIAYHELSHCGVEVDAETGELKLDENNRLKTKMIKHDIFLTSFKKEIEIFGFAGADKDVAEFMNEILEDKEKIKKNKKKFLAEFGIEIHKEIGESLTKKKKKVTIEDDDFELDEEPTSKKKKKKKSSEIEMTTEKKRKSVKTSEELEAEADKLLGITKKKKDRFVEIDMKEYNRKKFGGKGARV